MTYFEKYNLLFWVRFIYLLDPNFSRNSNLTGSKDVNNDIDQERLDFQTFVEIECMEN
jgi:hypothetical protein